MGALFPSKYIVTYGHADNMFQTYQEEQVIVKAADEEVAKEMVLNMIYPRYKYIKLVSVQSKRDYDKKQRGKIKEEKRRSKGK